LVIACGDQFTYVLVIDEHIRRDFEDNRTRRQ